MAHISKHGDKWRAQVAKRGIRRSAVWDTKREAERWAARVEDEIEANRTARKSFKDAAQRYLREVSSKKDGQRWEEFRIQAMIEHFGEIALFDLDAPDIAKWRDTRLKSVSGSTVVRESTLLKHLLSTARDEWRWMDHNPFRGVKMPSEAEPRHARWRWNQIRKVLRHARAGGPKMQEVADAFHIALRTGMRLQEVLAAPQGFDRDRRVVTLARTKTGRAVVPVGRIAAKLLERPAFTVGANEASTLFARMTKQLMITGLTLHDSRATALTHMAKKVPVEILAKVSRHRDISMLVRTYYRPTPEEVARRL
jgi:site-specific recombinase XerD